MKDAIKARQPAINEDPIVTFDDFPPDDGTYSVSYDFHLLDPGFNTVQKNTDAGTYICVPKGISAVQDNCDRRSLTIC